MAKADVKLAPCGIDCSVCGTAPCDGCIADRRNCWSDDCAIYHCCSSKSLDHCGSCSELDTCSHIEQFNQKYESHIKAIERLKTLRQI